MIALPETAALSVLEPDAERWVELVESRPEALPFHHPAWMAALADTYGFRPFVLGLDDGAGGLAGGLPMMDVRGPLGRGRRWISLPFTDHCPPLGLAGVPVADLLNAARAEAGVARVELHAEVEGGHLDAGAVRHVLALQADADAVLRAFHRSQVQRNIKKAEKSGVVVRRATSADEVTGAFYRLHLGTRRRLGVPVQPRRFFARLWERMLEPGLGFVLLAEHDGVPVAAALFLAYGETVIYKYGASDAGSWGLRPNHAIFWDAIRWSCEAGYRWFDFGRSGSDDASLRRFKSWWGSEELPLTYTTFADEPPGPGPSGRMLAPVIRRGPQWVCRGLGELLYKYAA